MTSGTETLELQAGKHSWLHVRHNFHVDMHQCRRCLSIKITPFPRRRGAFIIPGDTQRKRMKPTKAATRLAHTPLQSHNTKTDPGEPYDFDSDYTCTGYHPGVARITCLFAGLANCCAHYRTGEICLYDQPGGEPCEHGFPGNASYHNCAEESAEKSLTN